MRYAARRDATHFQLATDLRTLGFSVADTSRMGDSFPDLVLGRAGVDRLVEIKTLRQRKHVTYAQPRTAGQQSFADTWRGAPVILAYSLDDILTAWSNA